jgi:hypothetical protein
MTSAVTAAGDQDRPHSPSGTAALTSGAVAMLAQLGTNGARLLRCPVTVSDSSPPADRVVTDCSVDGRAT